jgi:hypothetical protein
MFLNWELHQLLRFSLMHPEEAQNLTIGKVAPEDLRSHLLPLFVFDVLFQVLSSSGE